MVERRSGVIPPARGTGHGRPSRDQIVRRRAVALVFFVLAVGVVILLAASAIGGGKDAAPPTPTVAPPPKPLRIVFPEGFTRKEMAEQITAVDKIARRKRRVDPILSAKQYLVATTSSALPGTFAEDGKRRNLEGFLFPATYDFTRRTTSAELVQDQLDAFQRNWKKLNLGFAKSKNLTPYDVLIIASMVEEETLAPDERQLVAAVIYNRLKARMPLGIDATLRYGLDIPATESIRQSQLESDSPYNTRKVVGLPPTPIANPGLAALQAAAHPAKVNYLYFVRKPDKKHHFFTDSFEEFQNYANAHGF
ncbi:MAG: endolytic transglycosylase MltG [Actinomycetota bacterium]|nr:endolytic transglycosylase MltG [Actinomycetota bacterium]